ncbi:autotransporter-associated beta strand repeat-containing protein [Dyella amyloliquefaciens]|uniref:autotransporter-associated beta strand repeat-containing protein n=1 Tax=Dyella amyloliquefaciens TaxID=1770545 RepID=UPI00102EACB9|nr:autotransporter-associated beta strand repeat-containing protein [Dyella amyloliquefaciens]
MTAPKNSDGGRLPGYVEVPCRCISQMVARPIALALIMASVAIPAWAGNGGDGTSCTGQAVGNFIGGSSGGGNGGNAAAGGATGGAGGTAANPNGENGNQGLADGAGGGGGWNGNGTGTATINNTGNLVGGNGGNASNEGTAHGNNAGGGAGGCGAYITGSSGTSTNSSTITGGTGGAGGNGGGGTSGGFGGDGGAGLKFAANGATLVNSGSISGGQGGANSPNGLGTAGNGGIGLIGLADTVINSGSISGGASTSAIGGAGISGTGLSVTNMAGGTISGGASTTGTGGVGITGAGLTIINAGNISGGLGGGGTRASAITFTGGTNSLEIDAGSNITGNVVAFSSADTFILGGSTNATFSMAQIGPTAQYQGFGQYQKTGVSTWTLTGSTTTTTPWTISAGTLQVGDGTTNGAITGNVSNNAALAFDPAAGTAVTYGGVISGTGLVSQIGTGTTTLTGANTYTGGTTISTGTLVVGSNSALGSSAGGTTVAASATLDLNGMNIGGERVVLNGGTIANSSVTATDGRVYSVVANANSFLAPNAGWISVSITSGPGSLTISSTGGHGIFNNTVGGVWANTGGVILNSGDLDIYNGASITGGPITINGGLFRVLGTNNGQSGIGGSVAVTVNGGEFQLLAVDTIGSLAGTAGTVALNATTLATGGNNTSSAYSGTISGSGNLTKIGTGTQTLSGNNSYSGTTTISGGAIAVGNNAALGTGALAMAAGTTLSWLSGSNYTIGNNVTLTGDPNFTPPAGTTQTLAGVISDGTAPGVLNAAGPGTLVLTGTNSYTGGTTVNGGSLYINGDQTAATGATAVASGATLGGTGIIGGSVNVAGGTLAPGGAAGGIGTLTINGDLGLASGSVLEYSFGHSNVAGGALNDLTAVKGNLTLDGTLDVAESPGTTFGPGIYQVFMYGGALTNNGLTLGTLPSGTTAVVQTSVPGEVNLVNTTGVTLTYWDGTGTRNGDINGGSGTWQSPAGNDNWTNATGTLNAPWANLGYAIFEATPGTVTVDNSVGQVSAAGMQFASGGYVINGGPLTLVETTAGSGTTTIRVGDGTSGGAGYIATIDAVLQGSTQLEKADLGTLILGGANTYTGGTAINGGTLQVSADDNLGAATGSLSLDSGTLAVTGPGFTTARSVTLNTGGGTIDVAPAGTFAASGVIGGTGSLTKVDTGTLVLSGANTYTGGTAINGGTLQVSADNNLGAATGSLSLDSGTLAVTGPGFTLARSVTLNTGGGTIDVAPAGTLTVSGVIGGTGSLTKGDTGTLVLSGSNTYTGGTTINAGTLQLGNGGTSGSIVGNVTDNGALAFDRSDTLRFSGVLSGTGALVQMGTGTTVLNGNNTYSGPTTIQQGTLIVNGSISSPVTVLAPGTLAGSGTVIGNVVNQGVVWPGNPVAGDTGYGALTIRGSYSDPQGEVVFNTFLGTDGSPSSRLVLDGGTTNGTSAVVVLPTGVSGAQTLNNGIRLVQVINGGSTTAGAFVLNGRLRAGFLDYRLFRGSVDSSAPEDWFLRSDFIAAPTPVTSTPSTPPPTGSQSGVPDGIPPGNSLPLDAPAAQPTSAKYPILGPEIATDAVVQPIARQLGQTTLGTLHERIGDTLTVAAGGADNAGWGQSAWGRTFGQQIDNRYQTFTDASASGHLFGVQVGLDLWRDSFMPDHYDAAGVYFAYGNSNADVNGLVTNAPATAYVQVQTGTLDLDAYSGGAYWTHYGPSGWYVDAVLQGTHYDGNATTQSARLSVSGYGVLTSIEAGYPVALAFGPNFVLEPQAQIIWQRVALNDGNDGLGAVDLGTTTGGTGRLGVRGQWTINRADGEMWQPYVRANLWRDWGAQATTTWSGANQVPLAQQTTRMDIAAGVTATLNTRMSLYGQFGRQFSIHSSESGSRKGVWGDIGIRYTW